jgi:hypothetical protein
LAEKIAIPNAARELGAWLERYKSLAPALAFSNVTARYANVAVLNDVVHADVKKWIYRIFSTRIP